jgi:hypothetical protein
MPLGGSELHSGYKGYGLAMLVEIFCGMLGGSAYGPNIRKWGDSSKKANLGQCFIAIDPGCFAPGFQGRLDDLMSFLRRMEPVSAAPLFLISRKCGIFVFRPNQINLFWLPETLKDFIWRRPIKPEGCGTFKTNTTPAKTWRNL